MMDLYTVTVQLAGNSDNQVIKHQVTAAEIRLLEHIHGRTDNGKPPVIDIKHTGRVNRTDKAERARLLSNYGELELDNGARIINQLLGVPGVPLPQTYEPPTFEAIEDEPLPEAVENETIEAVDPVPVTPKVEIKRSKPRALEALTG